MQLRVARTFVQIALATMVSSTVIACGDAETVGEPPAPPPTETFEPPPPPGADMTGHRIDHVSPWVTPGPAKLPDATCQPDCLPLDWLPDVLRNGGLEVWEDPDWRTHGHAAFRGLWGVVAHHTGHDEDTAWRVVRDGRSDLAGPLSQLVLEKNGLFRVVAAGVSWHAGIGSYPGLEDKSANFYTIGIEAVNTGLESWSVEQYEAYVRGVAAILRYIGQPSAHVIGHKEWAGVSQGKWDPGNIDMNVFRADVQKLLDLK